MPTTVWRLSLLLNLEPCIIIFLCLYHPISCTHHIYKLLIASVFTFYLLHTPYLQVAHCFSIHILSLAHTTSISCSLLQYSHFISCAHRIYKLLIASVFTFYLLHTPHLQVAHCFSIHILSLAAHHIYKLLIVSVFTFYLLHTPYLQVAHCFSIHILSLAHTISTSCSLFQYSHFISCTHHIYKLLIVSVFTFYLLHTPHL